MAIISNQKVDTDIKITTWWNQYKPKIITNKLELTNNFDWLPLDKTPKS